VVHVKVPLSTACARLFRLIHPHLERVHVVLAAQAEHEEVILPHLECVFLVFVVV